MKLFAFGATGFVAIVFVISATSAFDLFDRSKAGDVVHVGKRAALHTDSEYEDGDSYVYRRYKRIIPIMFAVREKADNLTEQCSASKDDFPSIFTDHQLKHGAFVLSIFIGIYCFTLLAIVCDEYFLPCVELICQVFHLSEDVAAATFMSVATSAPELFTNIIGTFITKSDIGLGTVVGSSMFNSLGVASVGGLFAKAPIQIDWWPVTRDILIYIMAISTLVVITWDSSIFWYEALVLFIAYFIYFVVMFQNDRISKFVKSKFGKKMVDDDPEKVVVVSTISDKIEKPAEKEDSTKKPVECKDPEKNEIIKDDNSGDYSLFRIPKGAWWKKVFFFYTWPIRLVLTCTLPNPKRHPKLMPVTFLLCILWIGTNSYMVSWQITIIGFVFGIPDTVLGLTFLAAGSSLPESISMAILARKGEGRLGVSNALGANTMNILLTLGMPWFFKTITMGFNAVSFVQIESGSIEYTIMALSLVACTLYVTLYFHKFRLMKRLGFILLSVYSVFIVMAVLSETVFFSTGGCNVYS